MERESRGSGGKIRSRDEVYEIQGAVFTVYREMGCGFLEAVYQECMERELGRRGMGYRSQPALQLHYRGEPLEQVYRPDFICEGDVILELKAVRQIGEEHKAQVLNYMKAAGMRVGLLANFGAYPKATVQRFVL